VKDLFLSGIISSARATAASNALRLMRMVYLPFTVMMCPLPGWVSPEYYMDKSLGNQEIYLLGGRGPE
jgi:hypothetical protein